MKEPLSKKYANLIARARKEIQINAKNLTDQIKGDSARIAKPFPPKREKQLRTPLEVLTDQYSRAVTNETPIQNARAKLSSQLNCAGHEGRQKLELRR